MWNIARSLALIAAVGGGIVAVQPSPQARGRAPVRIGVFDSRALALAYYNSDAHRAKIRTLSEELRTAKTANDSAAIARLEGTGAALQALAHYQGFSTVSVANILEGMKDVLPQVAKDAGVSVIVSKWEVAWRTPDVEYVDVTTPLVDAFHPDAKVLKWIEETKGRTPIPIVDAVATVR